jgi:hypothetical protein
MYSITNASDFHRGSTKDPPIIRAGALHISTSPNRVWHGARSDILTHPSSSSWHIGTVSTVDLLRMSAWCHGMDALVLARTTPLRLYLTGSPACRSMTIAAIMLTNQPSTIMSMPAAGMTLDTPIGKATTVMRFNT